MSLRLLWRTASGLAGASSGSRVIVRLFQRGAESWPTTSGRVIAFSTSSSDGWQPLLVSDRIGRKGGDRRRRVSRGALRRPRATPDCVLLRGLDSAATPRPFFSTTSLIEGAPIRLPPTTASCRLVLAAREDGRALAPSGPAGDRLLLSPSPASGNPRGMQPVMPRSARAGRLGERAGSKTVPRKRQIAP